MTEQDHYLTVDRPATAEFKDRGSKFIAYVYPVETVEAFKQYLQALKKEHPKAVHHCFAYRIGTDGNNFRSSDDGEPSGSAYWARSTAGGNQYSRYATGVVHCWECPASNA